MQRKEESSNQTASTTTTATATTTRNNNGIDFDIGIGSGELSIKDRLPTNNISFQSASIHTVAEVYNDIQKLLLIPSLLDNYNSNDDNEDNSNHHHENKEEDNLGAHRHRIVLPPSPLRNEMDVRITGVVLYTDFKNEFLILGDPLHKYHIKDQTESIICNSGSFNNNNTNERANNLNYETPLDKKKNKNDDDDDIFIHKTPATTTTSTTTSKTSNTSTTIHHTNTTKRRKLITAKKNFTSSIRRTMSGGEGGGGGGRNNKLLLSKKKLIYQPKYKSSSSSSLSPFTSMTTPITSSSSRNNGNGHGSSRNDDSSSTVRSNQKNNHCINDKHDENDDGDGGDDECQTEEKVDESQMGSSVSEQQQQQSSSSSSSSSLSLSINASTINNINGKETTLFTTATPTTTNKNQRIYNKNTEDPKLTKVIHQNMNQGMKMILIDFKHGQNNIQWKDDDLIMVIGKFLMMNCSFVSGDDDDCCCNSRLQDMDMIIRKLSRCHKGEEGGRENTINKREIDASDNTAAPSSCPLPKNTTTTTRSSMTASSYKRAVGSYYIEARIIKNVNGTDVNLMHEALLLRRRYLQSIKINLE